MGTRLYVGNLSYNVTEGELRDVFAEGGRNVVEVKIVMDRDTGRPRGFAFVEMGSDDEATRRDLLADRPRDSGPPHQRQRSARARAAFGRRRRRRLRRWRRRRWLRRWRRRLRRWRRRRRRWRRRLRRRWWRRRRRRRLRRRPRPRPSRRLVSDASPRPLASGDGLERSGGRSALREGAQAFEVREDHAAALGLDQALALELRQRQRHGLARRADQVRHLLVRDLEADDGAALVRRCRAPGRGSAAARRAWRRRP